MIFIEFQRFTCNYMYKYRCIGLILKQEAVARGESDTNGHNVSTETNMSHENQPASPQEPLNLFKQAVVTIVMAIHEARRKGTAMRSTLGDEIPPRGTYCDRWLSIGYMARELVAHANMETDEAGICAMQLAAELYEHVTGAQPVRALAAEIRKARDQIVHGTDGATVSPAYWGA
jgi:hypothetical protein